MSGTLSQEQAWPVQGSVRRPVWLEQGEGGREWDVRPERDQEPDHARPCGPP